MAEALSPLGYSETHRIEDADLVILNTCHIREKAAEKVYSELGRVRQVKEERRAAGRETLVTVAGCVAQAEGDEIVARAPVVDLVVGPQSYHRLPELVSRARAEPRQIVEIAFPGGGQVRPPSRAPRRQAGVCVPHRAGGLRQVLHVLRRPLYARQRVFARRWPTSRRRPGASWSAACARSRCSARTSTPITARARTAALVARPPDPAPGGAAGRRAPALHDEPSARHERGPRSPPTRTSRSSCPTCTCRSRPAPTASSPP